MDDAADRLTRLDQPQREASGCPRGRLPATPTPVPFGRGERLKLYPLYHPAAGLSTPRMLEVLEEDFRRIPDLIGRALAEPARSPVLEAEAVLAAAPEPAVQLGLF